MSWYESVAQKCAEATVDEVYINGLRCLGVLARGCHQLQASPFRKREEMVLALQEFALEQGLRLDPLAPAVGGFDAHRGLRWHCIIPPLAPEGPLFVLRRHRFGSLDWADFQVAPELSRAVEEFVATRAPLLFCGETGSGKTTLLAELLRRHAASQRVVILEDLEELPLVGPLWGRLLSRTEGPQGRGGLELSTLFRESLRLRPDWLVFGELRGQEIATFIQALSSGQQGLLATIHAASGEDVKRRLAAFCPEGQAGLSLGCLFLKRGCPPQVLGLEKLVL